MSCIKGKVILITGASSGFGMVTAKKCVEHGAKVVLAARREDRLKDLCESLGSDNAIFMATDVTRKEDLNNIVKYGIDTFNQIDSLVYDLFSISAEEKIYMENYLNKFN